MQITLIFVMLLKKKETKTTFKIFFKYYYVIVIKGIYNINVHSTSYADNANNNDLPRSSFMYSIRRKTDETKFYPQLSVQHMWVKQIFYIINTTFILTFVCYSITLNNFDDNKIYFVVEMR